MISGYYGSAKLKLCKKLVGPIYKDGNADICGSMTEASADSICDAALGGPEDLVGDVACPVAISSMCKSLAKYVESHTHTDPTSTCKGFLSSGS